MIKTGLLELLDIIRYAGMSQTGRIFRTGWATADLKDHLAFSHQCQEVAVHDDSIKATTKPLQARLKYLWLAFGLEIS